MFLARSAEQDHGCTSCCGQLTSAGHPGSIGRSAQHSRSAQRGKQPRVDRWQPASGQASRPATPCSSHGRKYPYSAVEASMQRTNAIMAGETPEQLLQIVQQRASQMDRYNVTAAFSRAGKLCGQQGGMMHDVAVQQLRSRLAQLAEGAQDQLGHRPLANIIHACAGLQLPAVATRLLPLLLQPDKLAAAEPQHISNVLWAVANLGQQLDKGQLQAMLQRFVQVLPRATCQNISNTIWAVATLGSSWQDHGWS